MKKQTIITLVAVVVLAVIIVYTKMHYQPKEAPIEVGTTENYEETGGMQGNESTTTNQTGTSMNDTATTNATGLTKTTTKEGTGAPAVAGDTVTVNYTGMFTDGKVFDTSIGKQPFSFQLGAHMVIAGWDEGVAGMKVGEKRHLVIPASLGYGPNDYGPIPGNSTLVFDVELLAIKHK